MCDVVLLKKGADFDGSLGPGLPQHNDAERVPVLPALFRQLDTILKLRHILLYNFEEMRAKQRVHG